MDAKFNIVSLIRKKERYSNALILILPLLVIINCAQRADFKNNLDLPDTLFTKSDDFAEIDVLSINESLEISDISKSIEFIPLGTEESSFFQYVDDLYLNDSLIIINTRGAVVFWDNKGKFLRRFQRLGRGPEEYETIFGFSVDFESNRMAIADERFIKLYDLEGNFIKSLQAPGNPFYLTSNLMFLNSDQLLVESSRFKPTFEEGYSPLWIINLETEEFQPFIDNYPNEVEEFYHKYNFVGKMSSKKFSVLYSASESYKTYRIDRASKELRLAYDMNFGKYTMPEGLIHNSEKYLDYRQLFVQLAHINESENYFFVRYGINTGFNGSDFKMGYFVYDKANQELIANQFESDGMLSKKYPELDLWPRFVDSKNRLICIIENQEAVESGLEGVKKGDNPVLAVINLK